jgi:arylsulfatase A-like enzyme
LLASTAAASEEKPNIILVMADDLGFADLGCYGSEIETPNLDSLAAAGLRFTQFYNTAKCHSSRVSLLTGLYCDQAGSTRLSRGATIGEVLAEAGYFTAMVGKWHLSRQPTDFGFQRCQPWRRHSESRQEGRSRRRFSSWLRFLRSGCVRFSPRRFYSLNRSDSRETWNT